MPGTIRPGGPSGCPVCVWSRAARIHSSAGVLPVLPGNSDRIPFRSQAQSHGRGLAGYHSGRSQPAPINSENRGHLSILPDFLSAWVKMHSLPSVAGSLPSRALSAARLRPAFLPLRPAGVAPGRLSCRRCRVIQSPGECTTMRMKTMNQSLAAALVLAGGAAAQGVFEAHGDVGVTPKAGAFEFDAATADYRVTGGGADIWGAEDAMHFAWKRLSGDVTLTADVRFMGAGAVANRKAVLMVRQDLTAGSAYADVALHGDGHTALQFRPAAGATTGEVTSTI